MAQNSMLKNPVTGAVNSNKFRDILISANGQDAVLFAADDSAIYAIDIADNNPANAAANTITSIPDFVKSKLDPAAGQGTFPIDMEVNPLTKSVYVLVMNMTATERFILKVEKNGAAVSILDLKNVTYSKLSWGGEVSVNDMTVGNNALYVSSGHFSLDGELGWMSGPFAHNATFTKRSTTFFKSNQGGTYATTAPLETIAIGSVAGKDRIMGVTTCAPGFSVELSKVAGTGVLSVSEDFNVHQGYTSKSLYMHHDSKDWLFNNHDENIYRVGKKYIDGSQVAANKVDANATKLRDNSGNILSGIPADDMKLVASKISMMAYWDPYRLVVLEKIPPIETGALKMLTVSTETPPPTGLDGVDNTANALKMYPNPAGDFVTIELPTSVNSAHIDIISVEGRIVLSQDISGNKTTIDVSKVTTGIYTASIVSDNGQKQSVKLIIE
jgi:hypothetical protein